MRASGDAARAGSRERCACESRWQIQPPGTDVGEQGGTPEPGGTAVFDMNSEPPHLNFMIKPDAWTTRIVSHDVLEALVRTHPKTMEVGPELAESWETSGDGLAYTFHLRHGVRWHDERPFTSADVAFTFARLMDPDVLAASQRADFDQVDRWEAPDAHTFVLHLRKVHFATLYNLDALNILPKHVYERGDLNHHPHNRAPVGTGPFRFDHWTAGDEIVLTKNPDYWGRRAWLDKVVYRFVADRSVAFEMAKRGELDLMWRLLPEQVSDQIDEGMRQRYHLVQYYPTQVSFWVWNTRRPMFSDPRVRRALTMLNNRELVRCSVERCLSRVVSQLFPPEQPAGSPVVAPYPFDPTAAVRLLDEAGWRDSDGDGVRDKIISGKKVPFRFTFLATANSTSLHRQAAIVKNELRRRGIAMDVEQAQWALFSDRLQKHEFDVGAMVFSFNTPAIDPFQLFHSSQADGGGLNYGSYRNAEADRIVDAARFVMDPGRRNAMYRRLSQILHEEQPYTFLFNSALSALVSKRIHGAYTSINWWQERDMWIPRSMR